MGSSGELHWQGRGWEFWSGTKVGGGEFRRVTLTGKGLGVLKSFTVRDGEF